MKAPIATSTAWTMGCYSSGPVTSSREELGFRVLGFRALGLRV